LQRGDKLIMDNSNNQTQQGYDEVAEEYVSHIFNELEGKALDRALLNHFADVVKDAGVVCDIGCGPGHVARFLHERGVRVFGIDLSQGMVEQARRLTSGIEFKQGDMQALDLADETLGGILAFYSLIHIQRQHVTEVLREFARVLQPGGLLFLAFHLGQETLHVEELWGKEISVDFHFFERQEMEDYLHAAGFTIEATIERAPYKEAEHPSRRVYIFARKPQ
jgi:ubiquinone/menaquinone biosynthesis C-methylase UbiE